MCGIAGIVELASEREIPPQTLARMAGAIFHRGPDEAGTFFAPSVALANRRLSVVGLADGRQPIFNEDRTVTVVFNGELFNHLEVRAELEARGHQFRTHCDTEILVHLWEEHGIGMLPLLRGQFAIALYDARRREVILARDRFGICPLHWARRGDRLYFGSEIKAILASGEVAAEVDPRGLDHIFTFFAMATRRTAFKDISAVNLGSFLKIELGSSGRRGEVTEHRYWDLDFPDRGDEYDAPEAKLRDEFDNVFSHATEIRLRADVPVVSYLSGGVDSTTILARASRIRQKPLPSFTIQIVEEGLDETDRALLAGRTVGSETTIVRADSAALAGAFPKLIEAAESPIMDTSCAALYLLATEVRRQGYKVALTGEGADEALAGYPWFKVNRLLNMFDWGKFRPSRLLRRIAQRINSPESPPDQMTKALQLVGDQSHACLDLYGIVAMCRPRMYRKEWLAGLDGHLAYEDLDLNLARMKHWHPLNQSLYMGYKILLPGLLLNHKGDRPAMHNSVETRYPFLDEDFVDFCAKIHPRWKLKGFFRDKHLLRQYASQMLPGEITNRPKAMFRAPFANTFFNNPQPWVEQLLSRESLAKTPYFDVDNVHKARQTYQRMPSWSAQRLSIEMGLAGVMATQLWHHIYLGGGLCDLPTWSPENIRSVPVEVQRHLDASSAGIEHHADSLLAEGQRGA